MYDNTENTPASLDTASLKSTPPMHSILEQDGEITAKYSKDPQRDLAELQEYIQELQEWFSQLEPTTNPPCTLKNWHIWPANYNNLP